MYYVLLSFIYFFYHSRNQNLYNQFNSNLSQELIDLKAKQEAELENLRSVMLSSVDKNKNDFLESKKAEVYKKN